MKYTCPPCSERLIWSIRDIQGVILAGLRKVMKVRCGTGYQRMTVYTGIYQSAAGEILLSCDEEIGRASCRERV